MRLKKISALSLAAAMSVCTVPAFGAAEKENRFQMVQNERRKIW